MKKWHFVSGSNGSLVPWQCGYSFCLLQSRLVDADAVFSVCYLVRAFWQDGSFWESVSASSHHLPSFSRTLMATSLEP